MGLSAGVSILIDVEQSFLGYMGINLGGGQVAMAEQLLDAPQVGAAVEQVGGEAVPQGVGTGADRAEAEGGR